MNMSLKNSLIVLWVYIMYMIGLWMFLSGYLLKRIVVHQNSTSVTNIGVDFECGDISTLRKVSEFFPIEPDAFPVVSGNKTHLQRYSKSVIIIIDALRYDFVIKSNVTDGGKKYYQNKMTVFRKMLHKHPQNSLLFKLIADPPTTTLQRLKGITTGSLPTFIDVSLNFASSEIFEDSFVRQMNAFNRNIVFMGDDTWESIFPGKFHRSYPYTSFNVKDLDTVDNGIIDHIYSELEKDDMHVLIAHFLGVDHCGHRYGPRHPEMTRKLVQMNQVIEKVIDKLPNDTILLVLGDHGMTESGDHGGDSAQELNTTLFVYSPKRLTSSFNASNQQAQVDIVPTLSLLLGLPIPFSNLGCVIPQVFTFNSGNTCFHRNLDSLIGSALALAENAAQVHRYLLAYTNASRDLPVSIVDNGRQMLHNVTRLWKNISDNVTETKSQLLHICDGYRNYLLYIKNECQNKWATFNIEFMLFGIFILCAAAFINFFFAQSLDPKNFASVTICILLTSLCSLVFYLYSTLIFMPIMVILLYLTRKVYFKLVLAKFISTLYEILNIPMIITVAFSIASFSNSFVVYEDTVVLFLLQTILLCRFVPYILHNSKSIFATPKKRGKFTKHSKMNFKTILYPCLLLILMANIRLGSFFYKCREEQIPCENSDFINALEKLPADESSYRVFRLAVSLLSAIVPVVVYILVINYNTSGKMSATALICIRYGLSFVCLCTCLRWWLNIIPEEVVARTLHGNEVLLTRTAFVTSIILFITTVAFPILIEQPWEVSSKEIYTISMSLFTFVILQPVYLVAGDALSPATLLMSLSMNLYLFLHASSQGSTVHATSDTDLWVDVLSWYLLSHHWFYATAHQPNFTSIQWDAAFLVNHKEVYSYLLSGALVLLNTFSSHILHGVALPLIVTWSPATLTSTCLMRLQMKYLFFHGIKLLGTVAAAFILRRHLMVWKIFAPKLIYEAIGTIITMISVSISHCFMTRLISCYHKSIKKNLSYFFAPKYE